MKKNGAVRPYPVFITADTEDLYSREELRKLFVKMMVRRMDSDYENKIYDRQEGIGLLQRKQG